MKQLIALGAALAANLLWGGLPDHPELLAFPHKTAVTAAGTYTASENGQDFILSGTIDGDVTVTATEVCQVTLTDLTLTGALILNGDVLVRATGASTLVNKGTNVLTANGSVLLCGSGTATLSGGGAKKAKAVLYATDSVAVASGTWTIDMTYTKADKGFGIWAKKSYTQTAGSVRIASACTDYKDTGLYTDKKDISLSDGTLTVEMQGPKSVALTADAADATVTLAGSALVLDVSGAAARGVKANGASS